MKIDFYKNQSSFCKNIPGIDILLSASTIKKIFDWFNKKISANEIKRDSIEPACKQWQKGKPKEPCVFMSRTWDISLEIFDYHIWRFEKIEGDDGWYLGWLTEDGDEWDDIDKCNFDEYCVIEYLKD